MTIPTPVKIVLKLIIAGIITAGIGFGIFCGGILLALGGGNILALIFVGAGLMLLAFIYRFIFSRKQPFWKYLLTDFVFIGILFFANYFYRLREFRYVICFVLWVALVWRLFFHGQSQLVSSQSHGETIPSALLPAVSYIVDAREKSYTEEEIHAMLDTAGWTKNDIVQAFHHSAKLPK